MQYIDGVVKWGIIGCGDVCEVKSGPAFSKVPNSKLVAVMRRNKNKAEDYAKRHAVPNYYTDAQQLIDDPAVNAIYIATPPHMHLAYAQMALAAQKPVYIEKPVALDAEACRAIQQCAIRNKVPAVAAHYRRKLALFQKVKQLLAQNAIGDIRTVSLRMFQSPSKNIIAKTDEFWRTKPEVSGGGLFHDLAPHQLDLLYWFFGKPQAIDGFSANQSKASKVADFVSLQMTYASGNYFSGLWSFSVAEEAVADVCEIVGSAGLIRFSFFRNNRLYFAQQGREKYLDFETPQHIQQPMIEAVVRHFRNEGPNPCTLQDAVESMRMIDATK